MTQIKIIVFFLVIATTSSCFAKFDIERDNLEGSVPKGTARQNMKILRQKNAKDYATELCDRLVQGKLGSKDSIIILADHPLYKIEEQRVNGQGTAVPMKQLMENPANKEALHKLKKVTRAQQRANGLYHHLNDNQDKLYRELRKKRHPRQSRDLQKSLFENPLLKKAKEGMTTAVSNSSKHRRNNADYIGIKTNLASSITNHINEDKDTDLNNFNELDIQAQKNTPLLNNHVAIPVITTPNYFQSLWQIMATFVGW